MQISFVMLIFLLFSDQISRRGKSLQGANCLRRGCPLAPCGRKPVDITPPHFMTLKRFTVILYDKTSDCRYLNESRRELFCKKNRSLDNLPPTQDALAQHVKLTIFQNTIWALSSDPQRIIPKPSEWGWKREENNGYQYG